MGKDLNFPVTAQCREIVQNEIYFYAYRKKFSTPRVKLV